MDYYKDFKKTWLEIYMKQYKTYKTYEEKKAIKENLFKNVHLTNEQKEIMWERIVRC